MLDRGGHTCGGRVGVAMTGRDLLLFLALILGATLCGAYMDHVRKLEQLKMGCPEARR